MRGLSGRPQYGGGGACNHKCVLQTSHTLEKLQSKTKPCAFRHFSKCSQMHVKQVKCLLPLAVGAHSSSQDALLWRCWSTGFPTRRNCHLLSEVYQIYTKHKHTLFALIELTFYRKWSTKRCIRRAQTCGLVSLQLLKWFSSVWYNQSHGWLWAEIWIAQLVPAQLESRTRLWQ